MTSEQTARSGAASRGRPRDPAVESAILRATLERLAADGYARTSLGDIAKAAGVTRPTIYLRWANLHELVVDALGLIAPGAAGADVDGLDPQDALKAALRAVMPAEVRERGLGLMGHILADAGRHPDLLEIFRERTIAPQLNILIDTMRQLQDHGSVKADVDVEVLADLCLGSYLATFLRTGELDPAEADRVIDTLWPLISTDD
ncbi:DNA-binding transcriptional regulator, AcrR family [Amycolatopsis tolypomycina]|uniref:DNA-binding transcriptional regulator, AcrR family n=1 Tax=Amycolatopsis tolypomycina TaxID=208445 RepID=A0A1H4Y3I2_9PSEU|nr:TetR/AcrR family transcriptional regulator [Amycolatopsis tolypomycina]SED12536.1 DNA-binding transcriptional regulator, AcrR family [Amycolatopsis tolypomycina]